MQNKPLRIDQLEPIFLATANDRRLPGLVQRFRGVPFTKGIRDGFFYTVTFEEGKGLYYVKPYEARSTAPFGEVKTFSDVRTAKQYIDRAMVRVGVSSEVMHHILANQHPGAILVEEMLLGHVHNDLNPLVLAANEGVIREFFNIVGEHYKEQLGMGEGGGSPMRRR